MSEYSNIEIIFECSKNDITVSYVKSEKSDVWRTGAWFLKPLGKMVEEKNIYDLVKANSTVKKLEQCIKSVTFVTKFFWKIKNLTLRGKFETLRELFKPKLTF